MTEPSNTAATDTRVEKHSNLKPWVKGQSGNPKGRPLGSRNRLGENLLQVLADDFEEFGAETVVKIRTRDPGTYLKIICNTLPKDCLRRKGLMSGSGTTRTWRDVRLESAFGGKAENICSPRAFPVLTQPV